jgi:hypothetical protein
MNAEKLAQIMALLGHVRTVLDGGYHYSSPFLRSRGDGPELAPPVLREKPDALALLEDVVVDLTSLAQSLDALDDEAKILQVDTKTMCGVDLPLYTKVYDQLATEVGAAVRNAFERLTAPAESAAKPERKRTTRTPKASAGTQTTLPVLDTEQPDVEVSLGSLGRAVPTSALE